MTWGTYNKYQSKKTVVDGISFDSKKEANRYLELKVLESAGEISDLQRQVRFTLIPSQRENGKVVERPCVYVADFVYKNAMGEEVVEDTKGFRTPEYKIKRKLMRYLLNTPIVEV